jgi:alpha-tubulin suppressor-like RCC1 family protein
VHQWGDGMGVHYYPPFIQVPSGAQLGVISMATAQGNAVAVRQDGTVMFWGWGNTRCFTGVSGAYIVSSTTLSLPWIVGQAVTSASISSNHAVALLANGSVVRWGCAWEEDAVDYVSSGRIGEYLGLLPVHADAQAHVVKVEAGNGYVIALTSRGKLVVWGNSSVVNNTPAALQGPGALNITTFSAGADHALAVLENGSVLAWGQTGLSVQPPEALSRRRALAVAAGTRFSLAVMEPEESVLPSPPDGRWCDTKSHVRHVHDVEGVLQMGAARAHHRRSAWRQPLPWAGGGRSCSCVGGGDGHGGRWVAGVAAARSQAASPALARGCWWRRLMLGPPEVDAGQTGCV